MVMTMYMNLRRSLRLINLGTLDPDRWRSVAYWTEIVSAFLLAIATVASAYSIWQSSQWGGRQTLLLAEASTDRLESSKALTEMFPNIDQIPGRRKKEKAASGSGWTSMFDEGDQVVTKGLDGEEEK